MRGRGFCPKVECSAESSAESRMFAARGPGAGDGADGWVVGGCVHVQEGVGGTAAEAGHINGDRCRVWRQNPAQLLHSQGLICRAPAPHNMPQAPAT